MKAKHAALAFAGAAMLSVPAFAGDGELSANSETHRNGAIATMGAGAAMNRSGAVNSGTGVTVSSGTGLIVTPGVPAVMLSPTNVMGAAMVQGSSTTVVAGPTTTVTTHYWANVPADVERDGRFQRWLRLR